MKTVLTLILFFSFSAFAGKDPNMVTRTSTTSKRSGSKITVTSRSFAKPSLNGTATSVNTNGGWPNVKNDLKESPQEVKAKWNGFTPIRYEDSASTKKAASAKGFTSEKKAPAKSAKIPKKKSV